MSVFDKYEQEVATILGGRPTKSQAIKLSDAPPPGFDGRTAVARLLESIDERCWDTPSHSISSNWQWRMDDIEVPSSPEVGLERAIARLDQWKTWSFQMSTCSGLLGKHSDKRRAID